jgi:hypothetical protein
MGQARRTQIGTESNSQTSSRDGSVRMNSSRAGLWTPHTLSEAGCTLSSKTGDVGSNEGVPAG